MAMPKQLRRNKLQKSREMLTSKNGFTPVVDLTPLLKSINENILDRQYDLACCIYRKTEREGTLYVVNIGDYERGAIIAFKELRRDESKWRLNVVSLEKIDTNICYLMEEYSPSDITSALLDEQKKFEACYIDNPYCFAGKVKDDFELYTLMYLIALSIEINMQP